MKARRRASSVHGRGLSCCPSSSASKLGTLQRIPLLPLATHHDERLRPDHPTDPEQFDAFRGAGYAMTSLEILWTVNRGSNAIDMDAKEQLSSNYVRLM